VNRLHESRGIEIVMLWICREQYCKQKELVHTAVAFILSIGTVRYAITYSMTRYTTSTAFYVIRITSYNDKV